ncbi:nucleotidyltransferase family protein [Catalinimonas niigatensis]|uniref:nucleotidyltransferase family protein n=1 Tax=Catalinimonas niigatensis TaxID=1397264 RepID=UPI0026665DCE|nr:nucleotidyltransferase family protein [Catalinimonas niigatensis]WPP51699.1 nucleotidyltransferase family protein [Catalinimonas niigatensis]
METSQEIESRLKAIKPYLQDEFGVDQIGYFGSFAKGDYHENSDLDVLVSFDRKIGWKFFDLKDYLEAIIGRKVDLVTERSLKKQWKQAILQQVKYI